MRFVLTNKPKDLAHKPKIWFSRHCPRFTKLCTCIVDSFGMRSIKSYGEILMGSDFGRVAYAARSLRTEAEAGRDISDAVPALAQKLICFGSPVPIFMQGDLHKALEYALSNEKSRYCAVQAVLDAFLFLDIFPIWPYIWRRSAINNEALLVAGVAEEDHETRKRIVAMIQSFLNSDKFRDHTDRNSIGFTSAIQGISIIMSAIRAAEDAAVPAEQ